MLLDIGIITGIVIICGILYLVPELHTPAIYVLIVCSIGVTGLWFALRHNNVKNDLVKAAKILMIGGLIYGTIYFRSWEAWVAITVLAVAYMYLFCAKLKKEAILEEDEDLA